MGKNSTMRIFACIIFIAISISNALAAGQAPAGSTWQTANLPFRALNIASDGSSLWACGADESIAASSDSGGHWQLKHQKPGGNLLLNIAFSGKSFGYAAGTGGLLLITEDSGETWTPYSAGSGTVLQASMADPRTGLIRTDDSLLFTVDGGANWSAVSPGANADALKNFPYSFSLVALDSGHMAVMLKSGAAQYESQTFLITNDRGRSWQSVSVPNVTLYSFLRVEGKFWAIGTEVVDKDKPGGGHGVPVALYSSDGLKWAHSTSDLSACGPEMCVACTGQGCLSANGMITNVFAEKPINWAFPTNPKLTAKWAATQSFMCFVGNSLQCTSISATAKPVRGEGAVPALVGPGPLGVKAAQGPHCIACGMDHFLVDQKVQGMFTIKLVLVIGRNGIVTTAEADGAPTLGIKARIEQQAQQWIFEPYLKDGVQVDVKLSTNIQVAVVRPH